MAPLSPGDPREANSAPPAVAGSAASFG